MLAISGLHGVSETPPSVSSDFLRSDARKDEIRQKLDFLYPRSSTNFLDLLPFSSKMGLPPSRQHGPQRPNARGLTPNRPRVRQHNVSKSLWHLRAFRR